MPIKPPLPGTSQPWWLSVGLIVFALGAYAGILILHYRLTPRVIIQESNPLVTLVGTACLLAPFAALGVRFLIPNLCERRRRVAMARAGKPLGLSPRTRLPEKALAVHEDMPLFRDTEKALRAVPWALQGHDRGEPFLLFDFAFEKGSCNSDRFWRAVREVQTVVVFPGAGPNLTFSLQPGDNAWDRHDPSWWLFQGLIHRRELNETGMSVAPVLRAVREEALVLWSPDRQARLKQFDGWVIDCSAGSLLVYRHDHLVSPEELPEFLATARRIRDTLSDLAGWCPRPPLRLCRPSHRERRIAWERSSSGPRCLTFRFADDGPCCAPWRAVCPLILCASIMLFNHLRWWFVGVPPGVDWETRVLGIDPPFLVLALGIHVALLAIFYAPRLEARTRGRNLRPEAADCGLRFVRQSNRAAQAEHADFPLVGFAGPDQADFSGWYFAGNVEGIDLRGTEVSVPTVQISDGVGASLVAARVEQTVALVSGLGIDGRFCLGPCLWDREVLRPNWAKHLGLAIEQQTPDRDMILHASLDMTLSETSPERLLAAIAPFTSWVVEGAGGVLLIYRPGTRIDLGEMSRFLETVRRIVTVLREREAPTESAKGELPATGIARCERSVREANPSPE